MRNLLFALLLSLSACAMDDGSDGDLADVATTDQAVSGADYNGSMAGLLVVSNGDGRVYTGILAAPDIAVVGFAVTNGRRASQLTVEHGVWLNNPTGVTRHVTQILKHPDLDVSYLKLDSAYSGNLTPLDSHAPSALAHIGYNCFGYNQSRSLRRVSMNLTAGDDQAHTYSMTPGLIGHEIADNDDGVPCVDPAASWLGVALSTSGTTHTQISGAAIGAWLPVAQQLFPIVAQSGRFALSNGMGKCLDIAWGDMGDHAAVNQFTCNFAMNQLWYWDYRNDSQHPNLVSARSGKCVDVPSSLPGQPLQTYPCHTGMNQRFAAYLHNPQGSGFAYVSGISGFGWPISSSLKCLSVQGGAISTDSAHTEVRACQTGTLGNLDQRWFMTWR